MSTDEKLVFGLDLDADEFKKSIGGVYESISKIGDISEGSLKGLIGGFTKLVPTIAITAAAVYGIKTAFDKAFEGEQVLLAYKQFNNLASAAGLAGDAIVEGMEKAAGGLVDGTALIKTASEAIVKMGDGAARLPEIMELSRKASVLFGGTVESNFSKMTDAISMMREKQLKAYGILVDSNKAQQDYARSIGVTVDSLTQEGKQQAFVNAALEAAKTKYKDISVSNETMSNSSQRFKTSLGELGEGVAILANNVFGRFFRAVIDGFTFCIDGARKFMAVLGASPDAQKADVQLKKVEAQIKSTEEAIAKLQEKGNKQGWLGDIGKGFESQMKFAQAELAKLQSKASELKATLAAPEAKKAEDNTVDQEKKKAQQIAFQKDILAIKKDANQRELDMNDDQVRAVKLMNEKKLISDQEYERQKDAIRTKVQMSELTARQGAEMQMQLKRQHAAEETQLAQQVEAAKKQADENAEKSSKNAADAMSASMRNAARSASGDMNMYQAVSKNAFSSFQGSAVKALQAWGSGSKKASEAVKMFFLGALGEMATKQGTFMMLDAFKTFPFVNVPELAAGGGLVALGAALGAAGGGSTQDAGGGGSSGFASSSTAGSGSADPAAAQKKTLTMNIHGNYFETAETKRTIVDMMKSELDVTDYKVTTVT